MLTRELKNLLLSLVNLGLFGITVAKFWLTPDLVQTPMRLWSIACPIVVLAILIPKFEKHAGQRLQGGLFLLTAFGLTHVIFAYVRQDAHLWLVETIWAPFGLAGLITYYLPEKAPAD